MKNEPDVRITTLDIKGTSDKKLTVKHFHWKNWPERGLPEPTLTIINLLCVIRTSKKPIVVHCSDGNLQTNCKIPRAAMQIMHFYEFI